jgi:hypothetical protein
MSRELGRTQLVQIAIHYNSSAAAAEETVKRIEALGVKAVSAIQVP